MDQVNLRQLDLRPLIARALRQSDDLVLVFDYVDSKGVATQRVVSPIRFLASDRFLGLCLSREEPRQFYLSRCQNMRLAWAASFVMPVPMPSEVSPLPESTSTELQATAG